MHPSVDTEHPSSSSDVVVQFVKDNPRDHFIIAHKTDAGTRSFEAEFAAIGVSAIRCTSSVATRASVVKQVEAAIDSGAHVVIVTHVGFVLVHAMPSGWHLIVDGEMYFDTFFTLIITGDGIPTMRDWIDAVRIPGSLFAELRLTPAGQHHATTDRAYGMDTAWLAGIVKSLGRGNLMFTWTDQWVSPVARAKDGLYYFKMMTLMDPAKYQDALMKDDITP